MKTQKKLRRKDGSLTFNLRNAFVKLALGIFLLTLGNWVYAQDTAIRVMYKNAASLHSNYVYTGTNGISGPNYTANIALNNLLQNYGVTYYAPYYSKFCQDTNLLKYYTMNITGNFDSFKNSFLGLNLTDSFEGMEKGNSLCSNPIQINDQRIAQNWSQNWALELADAACAWTIEKGNTNLRVAIVDGDFDDTHEDLQTNIREVYGPISAKNAHGTTVLGTAGADANTIGIIGAGYNLKWDGSRFEHSADGSAWENKTAQGLTNAANKGAKVINLSYSRTGYSRAAVLDLVNNQGRILVLPAGNNPNDEFHVGISDIPGVILVGGVNKDGYHGPTGHARNSSIELCAMSIPVTCTFPGDQYGNAEGTSNAAPQVAATAGLILSINPCYTPAQVEEIITSTTKPILDEAQFSGLLGTGYLDMYSALKLAKGRTGTLFSNETWNSLEVLGGDLTVPSGVTLTIKGEVICFENSSITVKPGGKIVVDGGTLHSICNSWKGIMVEGNSSLNQFISSNQGIIEFKNNATIKDAWNAVRLVGLNSSGAVDWTKTGGMIRAKNSNFINNKRDVEFLSYHPKNSSGNEIRSFSYFTQCTFATDFDNKIPLNAGSAHITMYDVNGVTINGCTFEELRVGQVSKPQAKIGLYTIGANYSINSACINPTIFPCPSIPSKFLKLSKAAESYGNGSLGIININEAYVDCYKGVFLNGTNGSTVRANTFYIEHSPVIPGNTDYPYGLYLDECNGFNTEGNQFTGTTTLANIATGGAAGLVVRNTKATNNEFYRSNFDDLKMASQALSENRDNGLVLGLRFRCNEYANTWHDLDVRNDPNKPAINFGQLGMAELQGQVSGAYPSMPDNHFANFGNFTATSFNNIENNGGFMQYLYSGTSNQPNRLYPFDVTTSSVFRPNYNSTRDCPSRLNTWGIDDGVLKGNLDNISPIMMIIQHNVDTETDGGNTEGIINVINTATSGNINTVNNQLLGISPHLSNEVLALIAEQEAPFTNFMVKNILVANPHSARSIWVQTNLDNRSNMLSPADRTQINDGIDSFTARDTLGAELSAVTLEYDKTLHELLYAYAIDTTKTITDFSEILQHPTNPVYHYQLAEMFFDAGDWTKYETIKNNIATQFQLSSKELIYHQAFSTLFAELYTWQNSTIPVYAPNSARKAWLLNFVANSTYYPSKVKALLALNDTILSPDVVIIPTDTANSSSSFVMDIINLQKENNKSELNIYPNPAKDMITLAWKTEFAQSSITAYDATGKIVLNKEWTKAEAIAIVTKDWPNGVYLLQITKGVNNELITRKILINR